MKEEGLKVIYRRRRRHLRTYVGKVSAHPGNLVNRRFQAERPNEVWLTDITQFGLPTYKCYLSVIIDCFDGRVWLTGSPCTLTPPWPMTRSKVRLRL
ncbi:hypothetical protein HGI81_01630 [Olsenella sp. KGMB02461]|nr:hypothetical protein [Olsenella sp. KGMB02461]